MRLLCAARDSRLSSSLNWSASAGKGECRLRKFHRPVELVLGSAACSCISCDAEPSRLTIVLNVMSESPVADGRGGVGSPFSSSSESSITLRFTILELNKRIKTKQRLHWSLSRLAWWSVL